AAIFRALQAARHTVARPSLIIVRTVLGFGSPHKAGTFEAHGSPLGVDEVKQTKAHLGWPEQPAFHIPDAALRHLRSAIERGTTAQQGWNRRFAAYRARFPALADELERRYRGVLPAGWDANLPQFAADAKGIATRKASERVLQELAHRLPELV